MIVLLIIGFCIWCHYSNKEADSKPIDLSRANKNPIPQEYQPSSQETEEAATHWIETIL